MWSNWDGSQMCWRDRGQEMARHRDEAPRWLTTAERGAAEAGFNEKESQRPGRARRSNGEGRQVA